MSGEKRNHLEKTGRLDSVEDERRQQFLSEAIVTGDLDHPNIVPIHDVGLTSDNQLFYAMKRVVGTPWSEVIGEKSRDENLEILIKAADAIGFAHTRGVVHRDIKPENIMLGDFGVVMVMDWGLALLTSGYDKQASITTTSGLGGTPAFMAPEMATGPVDKIGKASDIYLLGATLFMIITGKPPHRAKNITECLIAVRNNRIRHVPEHEQGELMDVALKAMATDPADRYENVESFQQAIREYRSHAESISLAARAIDDLELGKQSQSYKDLSRTAFRFEESIKFWEQNEKAKHGLAETKIAHANAAYSNGDYDLGLSLLDHDNPQHTPIIQQLQAGIQERESRATRLALLRRVAVAMLAFIIVGGSVAMYAINREKQLTEAALDDAVAANGAAEAARKNAVLAAEKAESEREKAELARLVAEAAKEEAKGAREIAEVQKDIAQINERNAIAAKRDAEMARDEAKTAQQAADASRKVAVYEEYVSKIGLAKARLERNETDRAREILSQLKQSSPQVANSWEWRWLWRQANQSQSAKKLNAAITDLSLGGGRMGVLALSDGTVKRFELGQDGQITSTVPLPIDLAGNSRATSVAIAPDRTRIAVGTSSGEIILVGEETQTTLNGHQSLISDLQFSADGLLVSGSHDRTVRVWDANDGQQLTMRKACWHISPVRQVAVSGTADLLKLAVATADDTSGRIELWQLKRSSDSITIKNLGTFNQHEHRPTTVAITRDGRRIASGDSEGNLLVWNAAEAESVDYSASLRSAISRLGDESTTTSDGRIESEGNANLIRLVNYASNKLAKRLVSTLTANQQDPAAHDDQIRSIRFNFDGTELATASDDYTLKVWDVAGKKLSKTLKGHGGWVVGAEFVSGQENIVISASNDGTVRSWKPDIYVGSFVANQTVPEKIAKRDAEAHRDEIWSAELSPDGTHVVTASRDHTARVMRIDPQTLAFTEVTRLEDEVLQEGSEFVAMSVQLDAPNNRLYVGSADADIRVWNLAQGVEVGVASGTGLNTSFAVSPDGKLMLTGSSSPKVKAILWQLDPGGTSSPRLLHQLQGHDQAVTAFAITNDSKQFFTGDRDGRGILWDAESGQPIGEPIDNLRGYRINAAQFSPNGNDLLIAGDDEQLTRVDLSTRQVTQRMNHSGVVTQLSLSSDGRYAVTVSELTSINGASTEARLWDLESQRGSVLERTIVRNRNDPQRITSARFDASGKTVSVSLAATPNSPSMVRLWTIKREQTGRDQLVTTSPGRTSASDAESERTFRLPVVLGTVHAALPIDDHSILTMNKNGLFRWNMNSKRLIKSYRPHAALTEASFSFDGKRIATGSRSVKIWAADVGKVLGKIESPHVGPVRTLQFAPTASGDTSYRFATGGDDKTVRVWSWNDDLRQVKQQHEFEVGAVVRRIRFAPDSEQLLIVGDQGMARICSLKENVKPIVFDVPTAGNLTSCSFSADGSVIAVGGSDYLVRLWSVPKPGGEVSEPIVLSGHADTINDVKLIGNSALDLRVLTASADDTARLWDPRMKSENRFGREILSLRRHDGDVMAVDAVDNGDLVMTAGRDGMVILWPADQ